MILSYGNRLLFSLGFEDLQLLLYVILLQKVLTLLRTLLRYLEAKNTRPTVTHTKNILKFHAIFYYTDMKNDVVLF